ncbi:MAG: T9SS type A sorting domain-containing protein [Ignavibacterium sp.]|jgi:hypothetical protein|nr:T9SS type A sorting domain-containing protein [Ignavibacterium sp.]MDX9713284.1 T9SS type A sorting domain-containing protein [Ignavibacteriaceae bacterium]
MKTIFTFVMLVFFHANFYAQNGNYFFTTDKWEGGYWSMNVYQGEWFPTISSGADFSIDDYSWGQVHTKSLLQFGDTLVFDLTIYLSSGGTNADLAYFGFGDYAGYDGKFVGIIFREGNISFCERMSGQYPTVLNNIGTYSSGERITFKICLKNNNEMWTSIKNFNGSFDPSGNLDNIRGAVTVANATSGEGFIVWSVDLNAETSQNGNYFFTTDKWEGGYWSMNVYQGEWFPTISSGADFSIDDYSWGQVHTKSLLQFGDTLVFDLTIYLSSGGTNADLAYFGFGDYAGYDGKFVGIIFREGNISFCERMSGQYPTVLNNIGTYSSGERITFKICLKNNNEMWTSIKNFNGSFDPSGNLDNIRGAVTVANATSGEGFIVWSVDNVIVGVDNEGIMLSDFSLFQNYPNPFNPSTTILYEIPEIQHITIRVFDLLGKEVATLVDEEKHAGKYSVDFDGRNLSTGMYIYKIQAGSFTQTKKMILLK